MAYLKHYASFSSPLWSFKLILTAIILVSITFSSLSAQNNTSRNSKDSVLIKGFYKTYDEFLKNSPSILLNFSTKLIKANKTDSIFVEAKYEIADSLDNFGEIWGFCDGKSVFVASATFFDMKYWKLQSHGRNPYFFYMPRTPLSFLTTTVSATLPDYCELMFIDKNGRPQKTAKYILKDLFRDNPTLFKQFKKEDEDYLTVDKIMEYINRYNASATNK